VHGGSDVRVLRPHAVAAEAQHIVSVRKLHGVLLVCKNAAAVVGVRRRYAGARAVPLLLPPSDVRVLESVVAGILQNVHCVCPQVYVGIRIVWSSHGLVWNNHDYVRRRSGWRRRVRRQRWRARVRGR